MSAGEQAPTARLFVAGDLPPAVVRGVEAWQRATLQPREGLRVNRALHVTLAFLGDVFRTRIGEVVDVLAGIPFRTAECDVGAPAFLPARGRKRVIALPLTDVGGELHRVQAELAHGLVARGLFEAEERPWLPHVTVARFRRYGHQFPLQNVTIQRFGVVRVVLYSSVLERAGAVHTPLAVFTAS